MTESTTFKSMQLHSWRQYGSVDIKFHPRLTIITGANGAGKTTILNLIGKHYGWNVNFIGSPHTGFLDKLSKPIKGLFSSWFKTDKTEESASEVKVGSFEYCNGMPQGTVWVAKGAVVTYQPSLKNVQGVRGIYVPSHRPIFAYQNIGSIPTQPHTSAHAYSVYSGEVQARYNGGGGNMLHHIKAALLSMAVWGYATDPLVPDLVARSTFEAFEKVLKEILPPKLGFIKLSIANPEVILQTKTGNFAIDAVSGGVASLIDLAWQIFMFSNDYKGQFVVTIDEPENHLHPELQQTLFPALLRTFPNAQFIVATHNPIIIASVPDSNVYALKFESDDRVYSVALDNVDKSGTSNEILREVLGLPYSMPIWVSDKLREISTRYMENELTQDSLRKMRAELISLGLEKYAPEAIARVVGSGR